MSHPREHLLKRRPKHVQFGEQHPLLRRRHRDRLTQVRRAGAGTTRKPPSTSPVFTAATPPIPFTAATKRST
ncbi:MAG: hypothetical protein QM783_12165 [Phycisphaerales bacterium]